MRRVLSVVVLFFAGSLSLSPGEALAHWGHGGCSSYYSGYTYYYPRYYYPTYNSCYYGNYGSYYGNGYYPYPAYGYNSPYNNLGFGNLGLGGGNLLGLLAGNGLTGAYLSGSLLQPSYLSMPVSVGYGQSGFLQIPMGNSAGRATYLQIPVNTGYGPSSYLQVELGRNSGNTVPASPTPSATPNVPPFGAVPGVNTATASQFTYDTPRTPADEIPEAVLPPENRSAPVIAAVEPATNQSSSGHGKSVASTTAAHSQIQFVSWSSPQETDRVRTAATEPPRAKVTSFSLVSPELQENHSTGASRELSFTNDLAFAPEREGTPWMVK